MKCGSNMFMDCGKYYLYMLTISLHMKLSINIVIYEAYDFIVSEQTH